MSTPSPSSTPPMSPSSTGTGTTQATSISSSPDTTGAPPGQLGSKSARRHASYYPNLSASNGTKPQKPFSRSAAKRESVMTLGSIEHLQHYFTKTGIAAKKNPLAKTQPGLVPAIGGPTHIRTSPSITTQFPMLNLPPSPLVPEPLPAHPNFPKHDIKTETDSETLKAIVVEDLKKVEQVWSLDASADGTTNTDTKSAVDVLALLKGTTRAIRSIRNYLLSLPDEDAGTIRASFRPHNLGPSAALAKAQSSFPTLTSQAGATSTPIKASSSPPNSTATITDPLTLIRRSALEVLSVLRIVEETCRLPLSDSAYDALDAHTVHANHSSDPSDARSESTGGGDAHSRVASPEFGSDAGSIDLLHPSSRRPEADTSVRFIQVQGRHGLESIPVWEDEEEEDPFMLPEYGEGAEKRERWDEKIEAAGAVNSGWLYRRDVRLTELERERRVVENYLDVVDVVLFNGDAGKKKDESGQWDGQGQDTGQQPSPPSSPRSGERKSSAGERGWDKERKKLLLSSSGRPKSKSRTSRRASAEGGMRVSGALFLSPGEGVGKRRVSTGMLNLGLGGVVTEEPTPLHRESGGLGGIGEDPAEDENIFGAYQQGILEEEEEAETEELDDDELPDWARRDNYVDDDLDRAHAIIKTFLPSHLGPVLSPPPRLDSPSSRDAFLSSLTSGQVLCTAYNAVVRNSKHPWGYVSKDSIHDISRLEAESGEGGKKGWTFRRTDNLRLWAGALKLRYMLPIQLPSSPVPIATPSTIPIPLPGGSTGGSRASTPLSSPTKATQNVKLTPAGPRISISGTNGTTIDGTPRTRNAEDSIPFDAKVVARKDEGWETMLENVLIAWVRKVVDERREVR